MATEKKKRTSKSAAIAEKPKRTVKPPKTPEVSYILVSLPLLEATNQERKLKYEMVRDFIKTYYKIKSEIDSDKRHALYEYFKLIVKIIETLSSLVKFNLKIPTHEISNEKHSIYNTNYKSKYSNIMNTSNSVYDYYLDNNTMESAIDNIFAYSLLRAFSGPDPIGAYYIGACPRCGKIFEKKRGDQEYCGPVCLSASMQRRYDEKQRRKTTQS